MLPTRESLPADLMVLLGFADICRAIKRNLKMVEGKIVAGTVNSSDVLDGLWDKENALPRWRAAIGEIEANIRSAQMQRLARATTRDSALNLGADLDSFTADAQTLIAAIRAHPVLFKPDGTENDTIEDVAGQRRAVVYAAGELNDLLPFVRACLAHFA